MVRSLVALIILCWPTPLVQAESESKTAKEGRNLLSRRLQPAERNAHLTYQARTASCVFDVLHGSTYLAQAGTSIDAATRKCHGPTTHTNENKALCSVSVTQIIESFAYAASFMSSVAIDCTNQDNWRAACSAAITNLVGAIGDLAQAGSGMSYDCPGAANHPGVRRLNETAKSDGENLQNMTKRRLWSPIEDPVWTYQAHMDNMHSKNQKAEDAFCGIYSAQSAFFLARAGLNINEAVYTCPGVAAGSEPDKAVCGIATSGIILSLVNVASFISGAVAQCQHGVNAPAACTADVTKLVAALTVVANAAQGIFVSCVNGDTEMIAPAPRRLQQDNTTDFII